MRILLLGPVNTPHVEHLALAMRERGHAVEVGGYLEPGLPPSSLGDAGIPVSLIEGPWFPWIRRLLRRVRPDVVHAHWLPMATAAGLAGARPLVATAWGSDVYYASRLHRLGNRWIVRRADRVMSDSAALHDDLRALGAPAERSMVLNWGVDTERFRPASADERSALRERLGLGAGPVVLHTRSLKPLYNPEVVTAAFERAAERLPTAELVLKHIGADSPDLGPLPERARLIGHVPYDELVAYYRVADAFVSVPRSDSSPRSVWEAMACGVPCVLSDLPWVHELIEDERDALVVTPEPAPVADALLRVIGDAALSARLAGAARRLVVEHRSQAHEMDRLEGVYAELAGNGRAGTDDVSRIRAAYEERDAAGGRVPYAQPGYLAYLQDLEWQILRALREAGIDLDGAAVLDVGAGSGQLLHRLVEFGAARGAGIELMPSRVAVARERYPALEIVEGDASKLPYADASFDLVTQFTCLSSILDRALRRAVAAEMWRVLRPGGAVLSYDLRPSPAPIAAVGTALRRRGQRSGGPLWTPVEPLGAAEVRALFPGEHVVSRAVSLNVALPAGLRARRGVALALGAVPALRSHHLAVIRRPGAQRASTSESSSAA
jgi:glycosyltransferase involved in cell wall biosynthesis/SAM-dependent methyltransferase